MLENFVNNAAPVLANAFESLGDWIERGIDSVNWESAGTKIGQALESAAQWFIKAIEGLPWEKAATAAGNALHNIPVSVDWASLASGAIQAGQSIANAIVSGIMNSGIGIALQNIAIGFERSMLSAVGNFAASVGTLAMKLGMSPSTLVGLGSSAKQTASETPAVMDFVREHGLIVNTNRKGEYDAWGDFVYRDSNGEIQWKEPFSRIDDPGARPYPDINLFGGSGSNAVTSLTPSKYVTFDESEMREVESLIAYSNSIDRSRWPKYEEGVQQCLDDYKLFAEGYKEYVESTKTLEDDQYWRDLHLGSAGMIGSGSKYAVGGTVNHAIATMTPGSYLNPDLMRYTENTYALDPRSGRSYDTLNNTGLMVSDAIRLMLSYGRLVNPNTGKFDATAVIPENYYEVSANSELMGKYVGNQLAQYDELGNKIIRLTGAVEVANSVASGKSVQESVSEGDHRGIISTGPGSLSERQQGGTPSYSSGQSLSESRSSGGSGGSKKGGTGKSDPGFDYPDDYPLERLPPEIRAQREAALAAQEDNSGALITLTDQLAALPPRLQTALKADTLDYGNISNIMKEAFGSTLTSEELKNIDLLDEKTRDDLIAIASLYPTLPEYLKKIEKNTDEIAKEEKKTSEEGEKTSDNTKQTAENTKDTGPSEESKQLASLLQNTLSAGQTPGPNESTDPYDSKFYSSYIGPTSGYIPWLEQTGEGSRRISSWMLGAAGAINGLGLSSGYGQIPTGPYTTQEMINQAIVQVIPQLDSSELETLKDRLVNEGWNADLIINVQDAEAWAAKSALQQDTSSTHWIYVNTVNTVTNRYKNAITSREFGDPGSQNYKSTLDYSNPISLYNIPAFAEGGYTGEYEGLAYLHPHERVIPDSKAQYPSVSLSIDLRGATITGDSADVFADKIASRVKEELHGEMYR